MTPQQRQNLPTHTRRESGFDVWVLTKGGLVSVNFADRTILHGLTTCKYAPIAFGFTTVRSTVSLGCVRVLGMVRSPNLSPKQTFLCAGYKNRKRCAFSGLRAHLAWRVVGRRGRERQQSEAGILHENPKSVFVYRMSPACLLHSCFQIRLSLDAFLRYMYLIMYNCIPHVSHMYPACKSGLPLQIHVSLMYPSFITCVIPPPMG